MIWDHKSIGGQMTKFDGHLIDDMLGVVHSHHHGDCRLVVSDQLIRSLLTKQGLQLIPNGFGQFSAIDHGVNAWFEPEHDRARGSFILVLPVPFSDGHEVCLFGVCLDEGSARLIFNFGGDFPQLVFLEPCFHGDGPLKKLGSIESGDKVEIKVQHIDAAIKAQLC